MLRHLPTNWQFSANRDLFKAGLLAFTLHLLGLVGLVSMAHTTSNVESPALSAISAEFLVPSNRVQAQEKPVQPVTPEKSRRTPSVKQTKTLMDSTVLASMGAVLSSVSPAVESIALEATPVASKAEPTVSSTQAVVLKAPLAAFTPAAAPVLDTPVIFDAAYLNNPAPQYPAVSRLRGEVGITLLSVHIGADGKAIEIAVRKSSGSDKLDLAAVSAVGKWRFIPSKRAGIGINSWVTIPIEYTLNKT